MGDPVVVTGDGGAGDMAGAAALAAAGAAGVAGAADEKASQANEAAARAEAEAAAAREQAARAEAAAAAKAAGLSEDEAAAIADERIKRALAVRDADAAIGKALTPPPPPQPPPPDQPPRGVAGRGRNDTSGQEGAPKTKRTWRHKWNMEGTEPS